MPKCPGGKIRSKGGGIEPPLRRTPSRLQARPAGAGNTRSPDLQHRQCLPSPGSINVVAQLSQNCPDEILVRCMIPKKSL